MMQPIIIVFAVLTWLGSSAPKGATQAIGGAQLDRSQAIPTSANVLGPPSDAGPIVVRACFDLHDINEINDGAESFEFTGVMTLTWRDPRQAFDPAIEGVEEKVFQGAYQFNEISPSWYPQLVLVNESGLYQKSGVVLRVRPDGTSILVETVNAVAESEFNMKRYPFDEHRLEAIFEVLGFDCDEVVLEAAQDTTPAPRHEVTIPQWTVLGVSVTSRERSAPYAGQRKTSSALTVTVDVRRGSFYVTRLVVIPLMVIVLLSFSVFWMDRSSLGDRISVSFIGILTGVAYQIVMSDNMPRIAYVTLMHGFLNISFLTMCATVVINLVVGSRDKQGKFEVGNRIDRRCRWLFPLIYFGLLAAIVFAAFQ